AIIAVFYITTSKDDRGFRKAMRFVTQYFLLIWTPVVCVMLVLGSPVTGVLMFLLESFLSLTATVLVTARLSRS
ncbi:MAG TPA: hypothetical protein PKK43_15190, partial [Spirochaetota bacterium]|nr:hypothetical protein [Spirochaetota bacterium]